MRSRCTTKTGFLFFLPLILFVTLIFSSAQAQQQKFPDWMDKVDFSTDKDSGQSPEPLPPIDPSTGQPSGSPEKTFKFGKPKLPDFSKLREKAIKAELEKKANEDNQLEQVLSGSIKNTELLQKHKNDLETLLKTAADENERHLILKAIGETEQKIKLCNELSGIIGDNSAASQSQNLVASLTPEQYRRAAEIKQQLFPGSSKTFSINQPASLFPQYIPPKKPQNDKTEDDEEEYQPKPRDYRPGRIKSIYLESKQQKKNYAEEESDE